MTKTGKIVLGCAGALFVVVVVVVATGVYMVRAAFQTQETTAQQAEVAFNEVRARFKGVTPAFTLEIGKGPQLNREPPTTAPAQAPSAVRGLVFDLQSRRLVRVNLPLAFIRMTSGPIRFNDIELRVEDIERYGPTLLLDQDSPEGDPLLVWTD